VIAQPEVTNHLVRAWRRRLACFGCLAVAACCSTDRTPAPPPVPDREAEGGLATPWSALGGRAATLSFRLVRGHDELAVSWRLQTGDACVYWVTAGVPHVAVGKVPPDTVRALAKEVVQLGCLDEGASEIGGKTATTGGLLAIWLSAGIDKSGRFRSWSAMAWEGELPGRANLARAVRNLWDRVGATARRTDQAAPLLEFVSTFAASPPGSGLPTARFGPTPGVAEILKAQESRRSDLFLMETSDDSALTLGVLSNGLLFVRWWDGSCGRQYVVVDERQGPPVLMLSADQIRVLLAADFSQAKDGDNGTVVELRLVESSRQPACLLRQWAAVVVRAPALATFRRSALRLGVERLVQQGAVGGGHRCTVPWTPWALRES